jgi:hypothetical protein
MLALDWLPWLGALFALFALGITLLLVAAPWRSVRRESQMDEEIQTRLLLGEDPESIERDLEDEDGEPAAPVSDLRPDE